jgi:hypothetical protein
VHLQLIASSSAEEMGEDAWGRSPFLHALGGLRTPSTLKIDDNIHNIIVTVLKIIHKLL